MNRAKKFSFATVVLGAALGISAAQAEQLKVGAFIPLSGASAATGQLYQQAMNYQINKFNEAGGWGGEPVKLVFYDTQDQTSVATDRFQQAVAEGVHIIAQGGGSAVAASLSADVRRYNSRNKGKEVLSFTMGGEAADLTGADCHFHHFRFATTAAIRVGALAEAMKRTGALGDKVYSINQDYSWGQEMQAAIEANAGKYGYTVSGKALHATNRLADFSPYALQIRQSGAQTVITGNWSRDLLLLLKAISESGMKVNVASVYLDTPGSIAAAGAAAEGGYVAHIYNPEANEASEKYRNEFHAKTGAYPAGLGNNGTLSMMMLGEALKAIPKQDKIDVNKIALALEKAVAKDWPTGEVSVRATDHQAILPLVVSTVSKDARFGFDNTEYGFKPIALLSSAEVTVPPQASCKMKRPN